jgi:predicted DsbA family dithiol-disulfide isomerase
VGANGTPAFFINGINVVGAQPFDKFKSVIDDELKNPHKGPMMIGKNTKG